MKGGWTDRVFVAFRISDPNGVHPIHHSEGARLYPGRWNTPASPVIYASEHYSTAMLLAPLGPGCREDHKRDADPHGRRRPRNLMRW